MAQNDRLEKNSFFQEKKLFNTKLLPILVIC